MNKSKSIASLILLTAFAGIGLLAFTGCQTGGSGGLPSPATVQADTGIVVSTAMAVIPSSRVAAVAAYANAASTALYTLSTGTAPTPAQIVAAMKSVDPNGDAPELAGIANAVSNVWSLIQSQLPANATASTIESYVNAIAAAVESATEPFLSAGTGK